MVAVGVLVAGGATAGSAALAAGTSYPSVVLGDGATAYWRLGETSSTTVADSAGANTGSVRGGVVLGTPGAIGGDPNTAITADGSTGYVNVSDNATLDPTGDFSLEAWAKPAGSTTVGRVVVQKSTGSAYTGWQYRLGLTSTNQWRGTIFIGSSNITVTAPGTPSTSSWTQLVMTRTGSTLTLYVNGVAAASTSAAGQLNTGAGALAIGRAGSSSADYFNGGIDEVAFYHGGLSATQVAAHYAAATTSQGSAPVAAFSASPISGTAPLSVGFTDQSTGQPTSWSWTFGDGATATTQNPTHVYQSTGTYTVSLTATNATGSDTITKTNLVTVGAQPPPAPTAAFSASPISGTAPLSVGFTDQSTGQPTSWSWTFGDGATATTQNPTHVYQSTGTYTVSLTATNATGSDTITKTNLVTVGAQPPPAPTAAFSASPISGTAPLSVGFTDQSTGQPTSWSWTFGDGATATTQNPTHVYQSTGTYTVSLTATNATGSDTITKTSLITVSSSSGDPTLVGAGDIADCSSTNDNATAATINGLPSAAVFTLGDNVYPDGTLASFNNCYGPSWGQFKNRTHPVVGNHDYNTPGASGYYSYFGSAAGDPTKGYYSYNVGTWHVVVLNGECAQVGGCQAGSGQEQWLRADLAANPATCTMAMWHEPYISSGATGNHPVYADFWNDLYAAHADVVLAGHDHDYERFAPQNPAGQADPNGIREFVVGTGGESLTGFSTVQPNSQVRSFKNYGVIKFTLHSSGYDWQFIPTVAGGFTDSGSAACVTGTQQPPTPPVAAFSGSPISGSAPLTVSYTDRSTGAPTSWSWSFGDGTTSTAQNPTHTYSAPGTYSVSLTATNSAGSDTKTTAGYVTVSPAAPPGSYPTVVKNDLPAGYWRLGEQSGSTAADSAGNNVATIKGGVTLGIGGAIVDPNLAMSLDGSTGYLSVADNSALDMTGDLTIEAWVKPTVTNKSMAILQKSSGSAYSSWQYRLGVTSGGLWRGTVFIGGTNYTVTAPDPPSTSAWTYLVLTRSGSTLTLYVNGVAVASSTASGAINTSSGILAIGRAGSSSSDYFNGSVDEVAVYPSALSPAQIANHYSASGVS